MNKLENEELNNYKSFIKDLTTITDIEELKQYYIKEYNCSNLILTLIYKQYNNKKLLEELYKNSIDSYKQILETYKKLASELKITNSLDLSILYSYLLWNGYFSITHVHNYSLKNSLLLPGMPFELMSGNGVCLHYATMLRDFLELNNIKTSTISSVINKNSIIETYQSNIERRISEKLSNIMYTTFDIIKPLVNIYGNHLITLIEDNKYLYVYDATKQHVYNILNNDNIEIINGIGKIKIKTIPTLVLDPSNDKDNILEKIENNNKYKLSVREVIERFEIIVDLLNENKLLTDAAYEEILSRISLINSETTKYGNLKKSLKLVKE